jgi:hypothetical protein
MQLAQIGRTVSVRKWCFPASTDTQKRVSECAKNYWHLRLSRENDRKGFSYRGILLVACCVQRKKSFEANPAEGRVTRLGEFSPIGRLLSLGQLFRQLQKWRNNLWYFFRREQLLCHFGQKNRLGYTLGDFFHKLIWSHWRKKHSGEMQPSIIFYFICCRLFIRHKFCFSFLLLSPHIKLHNWEKGRIVHKRWKGENLILSEEKVLKFSEALKKISNLGNKHFARTTFASSVRIGGWDCCLQRTIFQMFCASSGRGDS